MIKGKTTIELTDVRTGKKEIHEDENMLTHGIDKFLQPYGIARNSYYFNDNWQPFYKTAVGGLLLFDGVIDEDVNTLFAPSNVKMVGCAAWGDQNNTAGTARGGFNAVESEVNLDSRYVKFVYDFTTAQSNGTIASVCLTHQLGGYSGYGSLDAVKQNKNFFIQIDGAYLRFVGQQYTGSSLCTDKSYAYFNAQNEALFALSRSEDVAYYIRFNGTSSITIRKRKAYLREISLLESSYSQKRLVEDVQINLETALPSYATTYPPVICYDRNDNCLYLASIATSSWSVNANVLITKIEMGTWEVTQFNVPNTSNAVLTISQRGAYIYDGYIYARTNGSPYDYYRINLSTPADVTKLECPCTSINYLIPVLYTPGRLFFEGYSNNLIILNTETLEWSYPEANCIQSTTSKIMNYAPEIDDCLVWYYSYGTDTIGYLIMLPNYLATINNLAEPVTKTADKTMKITYTLQEQ